MLIMIEMTFLKELIFIKQDHQKSVICVALGIFYINNLSFDQMTAMDVMMH